MYQTLRLLSITLALCSVLAVGHAEPLQVAPTDGVLLLRNQNVLRGKISRVADHYLVAVPGGEIRVRASEVELFCHDLDEGYRRKRAAMQQGTATEHLALAEWCIRQELLGYAAREVIDARAADPTHPKIILVERRLHRSARVEATNKIDPPSPAATPRATSAKELEKMMRQLPPGVVETFTATVQPLLLNSCSTAGCHGRGGNAELHLERVGSRSISRRMTQRNLYAVIQQIDKDRPEQSPLLIKAGTSHARVNNIQSKPLDLGKYERLAKWIRIVTARDAPRATTVNEPTAELLQTMSGFIPPGTLGPVQQKLSENRRTNEEAAPKDPFDPAIFNQQHASPRP